jgi:hypothetical protein
MTHVVSCPHCRQGLQVPPEFVGQEVRCPACQKTFTAQVEEPLELPGAVQAGAPPAGGSPLDLNEEDEFEKPLEEGGDRKKRRKRKEVSRYGTGSGGLYADLLKDQRKRTSDHRGVLILVIGILSILCSGSLIISLICALIAYNMATNDLNEMYSGRMDRSGKALTQTGRILAMVGAALGLATYLIGGLMCMLGVGLGARR